MEKFINIYSPIVENALQEYYTRYSEPCTLYDPTRYILSLGGKRIRPSLVLMATDSFGIPMEKAIDAALAIEVFHNFTLVHDDIMDHADIRRGKETVHHCWGQNTAILSGDVMMIQAYELFEPYDKKTFKAIISVFNSVARYVCEGQQMDMDFESMDTVSMEQYIRMIELKTAVLLGGALAIGAIIGSGEKKDVDNLYEYGRCIGIAYQLTDDYLDTFGCQETFGKRIGGDILEGKKTFLYIHAKEHSDDTASFEKAFAITEEQKKIDTVRALYRYTGADKAIEKAINEYTEKALSCIEGMPFSEKMKEQYRRLAKTLVNRKA